jgi:hypothetical protein
MVNVATRPASADPQEYPLNSLGWLAVQLKLEVHEASALVRQIYKALPIDAIALTPIPPDKVMKLLGTKAARDSTLQLNAAPSVPAPNPHQPAPPPPSVPQGGQLQQQQEEGGITTERRRLTLSEIRGVAATAGVAQKLVRSLDESCWQREQELYALRGYQREQGLIEAESTGRLIARLQHSDQLNEDLDEMEVELAQNTSRASDISLRLFGVDLQQVIDTQADLEEDRLEGRQEMGANFERFKTQEEARLEAEARGEEYQIPEGERLGEGDLIDPFQRVKLELSKLGKVKRTSKLKKAVT